ncbi:tyrosine-type recombinase/integrase [Intrasporangium sp. YIM S08009]|uniref:tyrosine-type recombinase/integrase n=1 Tax=Intrasporangium zincisolvens TaxID=3080018 RepID=UPI002B06171B|nr:tyrosine-type recombinase/integrase [Intrasporangium sp. YIM S08009]
MAHVVKDSRDGRWLARWRDPSGRQRKKSFGRRVDADRFLAALMADLYRGTYIDPAAGKLLFAAYAETWSRGLAHLKPSTADRYRDTLRTHVLPQWGGWPIGRIAHSDVAGWVGDLATSGLSAGSVRKIYLVASLVLDGAVQDGRIARNPAKGVRLPRQVRREPRFLTPEELARLVDAAGSHGLAIAVLGLTGLRFGEFAALKVSRLDVERRRLTISESVTRVGSTMVFSTPKTHRTRSVPVPPALMPALLGMCQGKERDDLLFPAAMGGPIILNNWRRRVFDPACAAAGLVGVTPHDLRHTAASLAVRGGANVKAIQQMLGHASAAMTLDIYAGLFPDDLDAVALSLDIHVPQMCHNGPVALIEGGVADE